MKKYLVLILMLFVVVKADILKDINDCKAGWAHACLSAGTAYKWGINVETNTFKAFTYYLHGCEHSINYQGTTNIKTVQLLCQAVGDMYKGGSGVEKNELKALTYYSKACDFQSSYESDGCKRYFSLKKKIEK